MSVRNLESLFHPASIAVIGASSRPVTIGAVVWANISQAGFEGKLWPVNLRAQELDGRPVWREVEELPGVPELAVICTPAAAVPQLIARLGTLGTRAAIVLTAGMRETSAGGRTLEQAMLDAARPSNLRILGPNCIGALVPSHKLNASFAPGQAQGGKIAFVTQSGALATAMLDWAQARGIGFSHFISLGDSADVDFGDLLDYLASDESTRAILLYVEAVKHARKFMSAARAAARNKPVILVKSGRAPQGAKAAASHTGALAGSDTVFDAAVARAGMLRVDTLEALFDAAETLSHPSRWRGERLAIVTNGGGAGVLAADALALGGGTLCELEPATLAALDRKLPAAWSRGDPVDIVGDAPAGRYREALEVLLQAREVDGVLFMHAPTALVPPDEIAQACLPVLTNAAKPVIASWLGGAAAARGAAVFETADVPCHTSPERAVAAWLQVMRYRRNQEALLQLPDARAQLSDVQPGAANALLLGALDQGTEWLDEADSKSLLEAYGIPTATTVRVHDAEEAARAAQRMGFPVVLKAVARQLVHKSDAGGVALNLANAQEVRDAAIAMRQRIARTVPNAKISGFTVQPMVVRPGAVELIAGIAEDSVFGPTLLFGKGGVEVELRRDTAVALPPLNAVLAKALIDGTQVSRALRGFRGAAAANEPALIDALLRLSQIACDLSTVAELDINPLLADAQGVLALDARVRLRRPQPQDATRLALRPYPSQLEEPFEVGGTNLLLRPIRPEDGAALAAFFDAASPEDMRLRFFRARREVPRSELARYCQIDYDREMTFVAMAGDEIAGQVSAVCDPDNAVAEFAIQVAGAWQRRGIGRRLLDKLVAYLRARGTGELVAAAMAENVCMLALAKSAGFSVTPDASGTDVAMRLRLRPGGTVG
jgi:acetyltransferase